MKTRTTFADCLNVKQQPSFAQQVIGKRIQRVQKGILMSSYGEYLYGDHVDSPGYDDYLDTNCGDRE